MRGLAHAPLPRLAFFALCALLVTQPLFATAGMLNEFRDAQVLQNYEIAAVKSVLEHAELPLWNPYACGGMYALGTPQSRFASPPFLLSLLFGPLRAPPLTALFLSILGMEGFFRYLRTRTASALAPALLAPLFGAHGFMAWSFFNGWVNFYGFMLLPWVLHGVDLSARGRRRGPLLVALAFAFIVGFGGTYAAPIGALLAAVQAVRVLAERVRTRARLVLALRFLALAALAALCVSAFRLWPVIESMVAAPRIMAGEPEQPLENLAAMAFDAATPKGRNLTREGQMFVSLSFVPLLAFAVCRLRSLWPLALSALALWLATGYAAEPSLFAFLRELPVYGTLRYPQRFSFVAALFALEAAALGLGTFVRRARGRPWGGLGLLPAMALMALTLVAQREHAQAVAEGMWLSPPPVQQAGPFEQARGNRWLLSYYPYLERGSLSCWEAYPVPMSPLLRSDQRELARLAQAASGTVQSRHASPNRMELVVTLARPARVLVNQNYHPGWHASVGRVVSHQGLLAVDVPQGTHTLRLRFFPRSFWAGTMLSCLGLLGLGAFVRKSGRLSTLSFAAVPLSLALSFVVSDEPRAQPALPTNADGSPVLVSALPSAARSVHAEFALPVTLEGVLPPEPPDSTGHSRFAVYLKVHGAVPRDVSLRVRFVSSLGRKVDVTHEVVGASMFLSDAPRGALLSDVGHAALTTRPGEQWGMGVSLVTGPDKARVPVRKSTAKVLENQVEVPLL